MANDAPKKEETKKYLCNTGILRDGKNYAQGEKIELTAKEAEELLAAGAISDTK